MKPIQVPCVKCSGSGVQKLSPKLLAVYQVIADLMDCTVPEVRAKMAHDKNSTTIDKRVERLVKLSLVKRRKKDSQWRYSVTRYQIRPSTRPMINALVAAKVT